MKHERRVYISANSQKARQASLCWPSVMTSGGFATWARHQAVLDADLGLSKFPFDSQTVGLHLESFLHNSTYLRFVALPTVEMGLLPPGGPFAVSGWELKRTAVRSVLHTYPMFSESYHQLVLTMTVQRLPDYYTSRYVVGPALLVAMSFLSLCVPAAEPDRFRLR